LRIGTSGWNYPSGRGTWDGVFYPPRRGRSKQFDELRFYAEHFNTVEVNSTFYGPPRAEVTRGWIERTPPGFEFSVKLHQKFTHPTMFADMVKRSLKGAAPDAETLRALAAPNRADIEEFRRGIDPLANSGRLGALLAQFPASFKHGETTLAYLTSLLSVFSGYPVAVELRHKSWSDRFDDTLPLLNRFGAAWVQIDEPQFTSSIAQNRLPNIDGFYYMRLHGRNTKEWWQHEKSEDRYNYFYEEEELKEFSETLDAARTLVKKAYLYTNNHYSAKSVANAAMIKRQLGEPLEGEYPSSFVERYPNLADHVRVREALFKQSG
jgi:uncharacterized protein YecE (DUF72 family)